MTTTIRKPNVFIGCSREAIDYARAVSAQLEYVAQVNPWYAGTFGANDYTMEALEKELNANDFGIFVFAGDDVAMIRKKPVFITRDNTVFETGLFWGRLGRRRVFCIIPRDLPERDDLIQGTNVSEFHLLSDLAGLTLLSYGQRTDGKYAAAVDTACGEIMKAIKQEQLFQDPIRLLEEKQAVIDRKQSILRFFWEYTRNVTVTNPMERYTAFSEAIRNSFLPPRDFITTGAAIWKKIDDENIHQVGGNVGRGRTYKLNDNEGKAAGDQKIYVVDAFNTGEFEFFLRRGIEEVYILCYPLDKEYVLSVHISGNRVLSDVHFEEIIGINAELLNTIKALVGGDSK
ncbi:nucleotide-binding protein [Paenibacillus alkaliterrae]|uniref:TIR domain-containing protein n=1 Tax=Paenibacillus alkaliterrae TaxID=320909 RepID=UPI001F41D377|nr:TIR domain-containing protein [Paenibacillus alkaliterrae]MCF2941525.1 nucleotide-binding protein [Paenibacillus alkaliterrae]